MQKQIEKIKSEIDELQKKAGQTLRSAERTISICDTIDASWSGSDLVGHADLFYGDFEVPPHNERFSIEWGLINGLPDKWNEKSGDEVRQKIEDGSDIALKSLDEDADSIADEFDRIKKQTIIFFTGISKELAGEIEKFNFQTKIDIFNQYWKRQIVTRDRGAMLAGRKIPVHKYYWASASFLTGVTKQLNEFLYLIDKLSAQMNSSQQGGHDVDARRISYIDKSTLLRLTKIESANFDLNRLISFCKELDDNYSLGNYHSCAMLLRAILDHIPPIFEKANFNSVCAQYGSKSFKDIMRPLNETAKKIGDDYLHTQISKKSLAVTKTQISFQANLDMLLNEAAAILEKAE